MKPTKPKHAWILTAAALAASALLAGCTSAPPPAAKTPAGEMKDVSAANLAFSPQTLTVKVGTGVRFTNGDADMPHDVTAKDKSWQSTGGAGGMAPGGAWTKTFDAPGTFEYYCTLHSAGAGNGMWGKVVVE